MKNLLHQDGVILKMDMIRFREISGTILDAERYARHILLATPQPKSPTSFTCHPCSQLTGLGGFGLELI